MDTNAVYHINAGNGSSNEGYVHPVCSQPNCSQGNHLYYHNLLPNELRRNSSMPDPNTASVVVVERNMYMQQEEVACDCLGLWGRGDTLMCDWFDLVLVYWCVVYMICGNIWLVLLF